eukprot:CAMPEP_0114247568 /NCGR_PEP_ID=MMETSP0058-20121206/13093_1 /TAXON_ID=36894 /ORGANISM="Pyramimonas parkeae, CCMP726" /LENGTH=110 /DNA_ID=CAMNT_0001360885 /DNA_START=590 /DNA_END=923 /DNA_ORIENTATION=-
MTPALWCEEEAAPIRSKACSSPWHTCLSSPYAVGISRALRVKDEPHGDLVTRHCLSPALDMAAVDVPRAREVQEAACFHPPREHWNHLDGGFQHSFEQAGEARALYPRKN